MAKVLITGANGQLGTELGLLLPDAIRTSHKDLDITDSKKVRNFFEKNDIDTVINCAAYTAVDRAEDDRDMAERVNNIGAGILAAKSFGAKFIQISTDYVFNGRGYIPYKPDDYKYVDPCSVYGATKQRGEDKVQLWAGGKYAIIRTGWLYSPYGNNFLKTMLRLGATKQEIGVVSDQIGTPTYAADLAAAIVKILPQLDRDTSGIYHFTNEGVCSWYDFATEIMDMAKLDCVVKPIPTSAYPSRANRPAYSVLDKTKIKEVFGLEIPHWRKSLATCLARMR